MYRAPPSDAHTRYKRCVNCYLFRADAVSWHALLKTERMIQERMPTQIRYLRCSVCVYVVREEQLPPLAYRATDIVLFRNNHNRLLMPVAKGAGPLGDRVKKEAT